MRSTVVVQPEKGQEPGRDGVRVDTGQDTGAVLAAADEMGRIIPQDRACDPVEVIGGGWVQDLQHPVDVLVGLGHDRGKPTEATTRRADADSRP